REDEGRPRPPHHGRARSRRKSRRGQARQAIGGDPGGTRQGGDRRTRRPRRRLPRRRSQGAGAGTGPHPRVGVGRGMTFMSARHALPRSTRKRRRSRSDAGRRIIEDTMSLRKRFLIYAAVLFIGVPAANAEDWPRCRGPRGDGSSSETVFPTRWGPKENIVWKVDLPGPGASSPIVWKDRVFVTCFTGTKGPDIVRHLFCFDRKKGDVLWKKAFPAPQPENDYSSYLLQHGFASSTPVTDGDRLYVYFGKHGVHCFDIDGNPLC